MKLKLNLKAIIPLLFLILAGCSTNRIVETPARVVIEDYGIHNWISFTDYKYHKQQDGLTRVQLHVRNMSKSSKTLAYKVEWFDKYGMESKSILSNWELISIAPARTKPIIVISPSMKDVDFKIRLQSRNQGDVINKPGKHNFYQSN